MRLSGNICPEYGFINTDPLISLIKDIDGNDIWNQNDRHNNYTGAKNTQSILFIWTPNLYSEKTFYVFSDTILLNSPIGIEFQKIAEQVIDLIPGIIIKAALVKLSPGYKIPFHTDGRHESWVNSHRLHLPVITEPDVFFTYEDCKYHIKKNILTEVNNQVVHGVEHNGLSDRYHLMFDVLPNTYNGNFNIVSHTNKELFDLQQIQELKEKNLIIKSLQHSLVS
jgi:Aspartyl/Asparaginyl beta-hydroxylase